MSGRLGRNEKVVSVEAILRVMRESGSPMTKMEIAKGLGVHYSTVAYWIDGLAKQGRLVVRQRSREGLGKRAKEYAVVR